ncbi:hypothetical protein AB0E83_28310 [Streptomyces sp. NPDC035033]|uniref:hypothetical protein n=1 Tax=Streptomyces sp. NPDC035033 TaxID=3155368 RepID=UPI0033D5D389
MRMRFAGLLVLSVLATSCTSEPASTPSSDYFCGMDSGSDGEKAVQRTLRSEQFITNYHVPTDTLVQRLGAGLRQMKPGGHTASHYTCAYQPQPKKETKGVSVEFSWTSPSEPTWDRVPPEEITRYDVNGVRVESTYWLAKLSVACRLPGELDEASRKAVFRAELSNTLNSERRDDAEAEKRQVELLYILAGRATDALGCEGDPLKGDPVAKPVPTA